MEIEKFNEYHTSLEALDSNIRSKNLAKIFHYGIMCR